MKLSAVAIVAGAAVVNAVYPGDIVQYWVDQSGNLVNGTIIGGLASPPSAWYGAVVQGAIYEAAVTSRRESLAFQQLAVSHAAHNAILWAFHGTRIYNAADAAIRAVIPAIGLDPTSTAGRDAVRRGQAAARKVANARADDGIANFVDYTYAAANPGIYQQTPGSNPVPDTPQARFIATFSGLGDITRFRASPPPGSLNSTARTAFDTQTAYFWRESSINAWNRLATSIIGDSLAARVLDSAKFYAQLNYALANAGIAAWDNKFFYNTWRPVTAIQRPGVWLSTGRDVSDSAWTPLLRPTPSHQDYPSTHSTFGGAAAAVIRAYNRGSDVINATLSSTVTLDNVGVITRTFTNLTEASLQNAASRVFGGIHFTFAGSAGIALGDAVARETLRLFDAHWEEF
ncbi:phosphatidic acid phosphatase type 2/haloperoxidase [Bombardia bombarda]|uniref:Phosphatidic acid phosphatase type 2/haloperoxidase n=1 Tax=Bombardia bombarda TaxID=252184 RepID=A0AA39XAS8_9PEZI|nr:phosphatidic acid phosphatase type 2/haloperoxidase [Bombardia bombarda]